ncbi:MAG: hypothetical protein CMJ46_10325 [Planctomyces sp.]|nr:hypothetical protein [Planctomyces sp.]
MSLAYRLKLKNEHSEELLLNALETLCRRAAPINRELRQSSLPSLDEFADLSEAGMDDYLRDLLEDNLEEFGITSTKTATNWHEKNKALAYFTRLREAIRNKEIPDVQAIQSEINFVLDSLNETNATHAALMLIP